MNKFHVLARYTRRLFALPQEETRQQSYEEILEGAYFRGFNLWVLFFAMLISCIGLNVNSAAAIIGAMLISPLMGPVIGFSFGLAINDGRLKKLGLISWIQMVVISLSASTLYFLLSPFENNNAAFQSFSHASIFDILLAFFGGMAGFLGIIRRDGSKVLAGVAVATACIPPLCTAGFGLAHADFETFIGGLYFYMVNCLFYWFGHLYRSPFPEIPSCQPLQGLVQHSQLGVVLVNRHDDYSRRVHRL